MIANGKYTKGTHMKVIDILNEEVNRLLQQDRKNVLGELPAEYNDKNPLYKSWRLTINSAHNKCWNDNNKAIEKKEPLRLNRKFNATYQYLWDLINKQQWKCAITNAPLVQTGNVDDNNRISIDRIDTTKGYVLGNIQFITHRVNMMKWTHSQSDFINYCKRIVEYTNVHGIPADPSDSPTSLSESESTLNLDNSKQTWKRKRKPIVYFLTSTTNEPLYTDLDTKTPWTNRSGYKLEKSYFTPRTINTVNKWIKLCDDAYYANDAAALEYNMSILLHTIQKVLRNGIKQIESGKYTQEIGKPVSVIASLKTIKNTLQRLHDGKKIVLSDENRESTTDGRYLTQTDRKQFEEYMIQIDQLLSTRPTYEQATTLYNQIKTHVELIVKRSWMCVTRGITPTQFLANMISSSKFDLTSDDRLTPDDIATLDPKLQHRIRSQQSRGNMPDQWDKSNLEHKSWKSVISGAISRVSRNSKKRNDSGKDEVARHTFDVSNAELWDVINSQNWTCPYTGIKLEITGSRNDNQLSPDRINSNLGYVSGNVRFVTYRVNVMKNDRSSADFVNSCRQVANSQRSKKP